jgi:homoserine acetyltransferase
MKMDSNKNIIQLFKHNNASATVTKVADDFDFVRGGMLSELNIAYETWGSLNKDKSNVVVIFTGLSASSHVSFIFS